MNQVAREFFKVIDLILESKECYSPEAFNNFPYSVCGFSVEKIKEPEIWFMNSFLMNKSEVLQLPVDISEVFSIDFEALRKLVDKEVVQLNCKQSNLDVTLIGKTFCFKHQEGLHFFGAAFEVEDLNSEETLAIIQNFACKPQYGSPGIIKLSTATREAADNLRKVTDEWVLKLKDITNHSVANK